MLILKVNFGVIPPEPRLKGRGRGVEKERERGREWLRGNRNGGKELGGEEVKVQERERWERGNGWYGKRYACLLSFKPIATPGHLDNSNYGMWYAVSLQHHDYSCFTLAQAYLALLHC
jgi:hypothetical protein